MLTAYLTDAIRAFNRIMLIEHIKWDSINGTKSNSHTNERRLFIVLSYAWRIVQRRLPYKAYIVCNRIRIHFNSTKSNSQGDFSPKPTHFISIATDYTLSSIFFLFYFFILLLLNGAMERRLFSSGFFSKH